MGKRFFKHPWVIIFVCILMTIGFAIPLKNIKMENSIRMFFPQKHEAYNRLEDTENRYGSMISIGISLETPGETILTPNYLELIRQMTAELEVIDGVEDVTSITNVDFVVSEDGAIVVAPLLNRDFSEPITEEDVDLMKERLVSWDDMYELVVTNADSTATQIQIVIDHTKSNPEQQKTLESIRATTNSITADSDLSVKFYGQPVISEDSRNFMMADLVALIPLVVLVVLISLFFSFHTLDGTILPLITVLMSTVWTVGIMTIFKVTFSLVSSVIPVALIACGSAYGIHVLTHYYIAIDEKIAEFAKTNQTFTRESHLECILKGLENVKVAIVLAAVTTIVGFSSLVTSPIKPLFSFAIFTSLGIAFSLLLSVTLIPAFLLTKKNDKIGLRSKRMAKITKKVMKRLEKVESTKNKSGDLNGGLAGTLYSIYHFFCGSKPRMIVFSIAVVLISGIGVSKLVIDTSLVNYFPKTSRLRKDIDYVNNNFAGTNSTFLLIKSPASVPKEKALALYDKAELLRKNNADSDGNISEEVQAEIDELTNRAGELIAESKTLPDMTNPDVLRIVDTMERWVEKKYDIVGKAVSYTDFIKRINQVWNAPGAQIASASSSSTESFDDFSFGDDFFDSFGFDEEEVSSEPASSAVYEDPNVKYQALLDKTHTASEMQDFLYKAYIKAGGRSCSVADFIKEIQKEMNYNGSAFYEIPTDSSKYMVSSKKELASIISNYTQMLGESLERFDDDQVTYTPTVIRMQVQLRSHSTQVVGYLLDDLEEYARVHLPEGYYMEATGEGEMEFVMTNLVVRSQLTSLLLSLVLVFIIISISFKSPFAGFVGCIPLAFTIILNYMIMGLTGIKLDLITSIIASVAIGVGVDYTIHFMTEYAALRLESDDLEQVTRGTFKSSGAGIITNALAVGLGFLVLCFSKFVVLRCIGVLAATVMFTSSILAMTVIPGLFNIVDPKFLHPGKPKAWENDTDSDDK